jgi:hypothetical protein
MENSLLAKASSKMFTNFYSRTATLANKRKTNGEKERGRLEIYMKISPAVWTLHISGRTGHYAHIFTFLPVQVKVQVQERSTQCR